MFLEVKNPKNRTPKVILHPNRIFKSQHFVVQILIHLYIHSSRQTIGPRDTSIRDITKNWWLLKKNFGCKTTFGLGFLKFFTSKNMPPIWTFAGCKNFFRGGSLTTPLLHSPQCEATYPRIININLIKPPFSLTQGRRTNEREDFSLLTCHSITALTFLCPLLMQMSGQCTWVYLRSDVIGASEHHLYKQINAHITDENTSSNLTSLNSQILVRISLFMHD